ncbi:MAG: hypothetical protein QOF73_1541 [Thermomicrobiales bacterium]|nr:hypothetical protein [Thermomicrobiales bacterium]
MPRRAIKRIDKRDKRFYSLSQAAHSVRSAGLGSTSAASVGHRPPPPGAFRPSPPPAQRRQHAIDSAAAHPPLDPRGTASSPATDDRRPTTDDRRPTTDDSSLARRVGPHARIPSAPAEPTSRRLTSKRRSLCIQTRRVESALHPGGRQLGLRRGRMLLSRQPDDPRPPAKVAHHATAIDDDPCPVRDPRVVDR